LIDEGLKRQNWNVETDKVQTFMKSADDAFHLGSGADQRLA
jgi:hypothetical protein